MKYKITITVTDLEAGNSGSLVVTQEEHEQGRISMVQVAVDRLIKSLEDTGTKPSPKWCDIATPERAAKIANKYGIPWHTIEDIRRDYPDKSDQRVRIIINGFLAYLAMDVGDTDFLKIKTTTVEERDAMLSSKWATYGQEFLKKVDAWTGPRTYLS